MNVAPALLYLFTAVIVGMLTLLGLATTSMHLHRSRAERRTMRRIAAWRPTVLAAIDGDDVELRLERRDHSTFISLARGLLPTLRGDDHERLTEMLEASGIVATALAELHSSSALKRARAADLLGLAAVRRAAPELVRLLHDRDEDVRRVAARGLGLIDAHDAVAAILRSFDEGRIQRNTATMALLRMGREANMPLQTGLLSERESIRTVCAELLGLRLAVSSVPALASAIERDEALEVRIAAVRAIGRIAMPGSVDVLAGAMRSDQPEVLRAIAATSLGRIGSPRTISLLRDALSDPSHLVARNAMQALTKVGDEGEAILTSVARNPANRGVDYAREGLSSIALRREALGAMQ